MAQAEYIKFLYEVEELNLKEIAERTKLNFRTVKKYVQKEDWSPGGGRKPAEPRYPVMGPYINIVEEWLRKDQLESRKQRHTARKVYARLCKEHGFEGSESTVRKFVREAKGRLKAATEGFIPLGHPPGHAQIDFGAFKYLDCF